MREKHTVIALTRITKQELDNLKEEFGNLSYDSIGNIKSKPNLC